MTAVTPTDRPKSVRNRWEIEVVVVSGKVGTLKTRFVHTSYMTAVTPTDRPMSVRNRCVIEVFGGVFVLSISFRIFC